MVAAREKPAATARAISSSDGRSALAPHRRWDGCCVSRVLPSDLRNATTALVVLIILRIPRPRAKTAATYSRPLLGRLRSADLSSWSAVLSKRRATRFSATTRRWKARKNQPVSESILASSSDVQCQQFPISNKRCRFRTKDTDFEQKIRIPNKRCGFRTKVQDSE